MVRSREELEDQLARLEEEYRALKLDGAVRALAGRGTLDQAEAQLLVLAGGMMLCQWALGRPVEPPIELAHAGWTPPPGFVR